MIVYIICFYELIKRIWKIWLKNEEATLEVNEIFQKIKELYYNIQLNRILLLKNGNHSQEPEKNYE